MATVLAGVLAEIEEIEARRLLRRRTCTLPGCDEPYYAKGCCRRHYRRWYKYGDPYGSTTRRPRPTCTLPGCDEPHWGRGYCTRHYSRWRKHGDPSYVRFPATCTLPGCDEPYYGRGYCSRHYQRWRKHGDPCAGGRSPARQEARKGPAGPDSRRPSLCGETRPSSIVAGPGSRGVDPTSQVGTPATASRPTPIARSGD